MQDMLMAHLRWLKINAILMELQQVYIKLCCFLCEWDSRAKSVPYSKKNWPVRKWHTPGTKIVAHQPLVDPCEVLLSPLHIKLGLLRKFCMKALDRNGPAFSFLCEKFQSLSAEKIKAGVFTGPQIRQLLRDPQFDLALSIEKKTVWNTFQVFK